MDLGFITTSTVTNIKEIGKLIKNMDMDSIDFKMEVYIKETSSMGNLTDKDSSITTFKQIETKMMTISYNIKDYGKIHNHTDKDKLFISTTIFIKANSNMENVKVTDLTSLIKSINIKASSKIIISMEKEKYSEIKNYSSKDNSKMDLNMETESINIKVVISFKEDILKMKKEAEENISLQKEDYFSHSLIQDLLKYQRYHYQTELFMLENNATVPVKGQVKPHM
jgi:hypothetical protein